MTFPQGASDMPAWVVAKANQYARDHALTPFVIYQGLWNVMDRSFEREIIPMAREEGMALAPWNVLAGGKLRTDAEEAKRAESGENGRSVWGLDWRRNEQEKKMSAALEKVGKEVGAKNITSGRFSDRLGDEHNLLTLFTPDFSSVAIAYVMQKTPFVFPLVGGRKVENLKDNIEALDISLSDEQIAYLESIIPFDLGFPSNVIVSEQTFALLTCRAIDNNMILGYILGYRIKLYFCHDGGWPLRKAACPAAYQARWKWRISRLIKDIASSNMVFEEVLL
jgi:hypothetical protein